VLRAHPLLERLLTILLSILFIASFFAYVAVYVVTDNLLNAHFYTSALERNDIYDRVYTELLADPALRSVTERLLGDLRISQRYSQETYSQIVSALRLVVPPDVLRQATDFLFQELTAYLAGERQRLRSNINLTKAINDPELQQRMIAAVQSIQAQLIANARIGSLVSTSALGAPALTPDTLYDQIERYMRALAAGRLEELPFDLTNLSIASLSPAQKQEIARLLLAPASDRVTEETRLQVETALLDNDLVGAIAMASGQLLTVRIQDAVQNLRAELPIGTLSGVEAFADLANQTTNTVVQELNDTRRLTLFFRDDLMPVVVVVLTGSVLGLAILQGTRVHRAFGLFGWLLIGCGAGTLLAWAVVDTALSFPFEEFTGATLNGAPLPPSLQNMLRDVLASLRDSVGDSVRERGIVALILGGLFVLIWATPVAFRLVLWLARPLVLRPILSIAVLVLLIIATPIAIDLLRAERSVRARPLRCNGYEALCDRHFDQVVFPATHNAMAASNLGWIWPHHDGGLSAQLKAGVRAFLLDTHYGDTPDEIARYLSTFPNSSRALMERIINAADPSTRGPGLFLCHNLCALGATPLEEALADMRAFLDRNQHEVIVLILQDEVSAADTAAAFEASGLIRYVYTHSPEADWPTLREMIERNERVVVFAEQGGPPPAWYHHFWDYAEETRYSYRSPEEFDCAPNRGGTDKPLFLLNHWIARRAPDRVDAARINAYDFLLNRALTCAEERGHVPNFVAVDFYGIGDLFRVVDMLNGLVGARVESVAGT
jgi:hypothetical protein